MFRLLRYYTLASAVAVVIVTVLILLLARESGEETLTRLTEQQNIDAAQAMVSSNRDDLFSYLLYAQDKNTDTLRASERTKALRARLHGMPASSRVKKIKLYALDGRIVFSSVPDEIGNDKSAFGGFKQVLRTNAPVSQLTFRGEFSALEGTLFDRSVVASYLPLRGRDGGMIGIFEVYTDVTRDTDALAKRNQITMATIGGVSGALWLILLLIVQHGDRLLREQYSTLESEIEDRRKAQEELRRLASTDSLTGIANRRRFTELSEQELRHAYRYGHPISVLMIDLDNFKDINDTHGHAAGDTVLRNVAHAIIRSMRNTDIVGRIGGDEFSVVLVEADIATAEYVADRIRANIEAMRIPHGETELRIRTSIGGAHARTGEELDLLMVRADEALYEAKDAGRNTVLFDQGQAADAMPG